MKPLSLLVALLSLSSVVAQQSGYFYYSSRASTAYKQITALRFESAKHTLSKLRTEEPSNLVIDHLENYLDFLHVYLFEIPTDYERFKSARRQRLANIQSGDPHSPYYLFIQADIRLQTALVRLKFEDYFTAFLDIRTAWKLLTENQEKFPDFLPNIKDLATLTAILGTVPEQYRTGLKWLSGMEGDLNQGIASLDKIADKDFVFAKEVTLIRAMLALHLEQKADKAWQLVQQDSLFAPSKNVLDCFVLANLALRSGHNEQALQMLQKRPRDPSAASLPQLDFLTGLAKLRKLDKDAAQWFHQFLKNFQGRNSIKEALQKLAWAAALEGKTNAYLHYMDRCKKEGYAGSGEDQNALQEANSTMLPHPDLLKARLLFDGHYFREAYDILKKKSVADFFRESEQLEYSYRLGRILHGLKRYDEALTAYRQTMIAGAESPEYYACNAALQSGLIHETLGQKKEAIKAYEFCLQLSPDSYRSGLHQQAKAGILRLR